jgi:nitrogen fixation/metabolism regulation signal transduction histidine kinase
MSGYLTAAVLAVKSIDQLLHIVHDASVEQSLKLGLDGLKDAYKTRQELLLERLKQRIPATDTLSLSRLNESLLNVDTLAIMRQSTWNITRSADGSAKSIQWLNRQDLIVGPYIIAFSGTTQAEEYRKIEEVLQRYQVIGIELRDNIRPALIKALSITLAIMCSLLMLAFAYMAVRGKARIQKLVQGFIDYAEKDNKFRFSVHANNELGLLSTQFNHMADELNENHNRTLGLEKLASWQTIARKMAHEIKNPLTPIQIMIGQLKRHYEGSDKEYAILLDKAHSVILEEVACLRRMVDDFSQFAQLPSPRLTSCNAIHCAKQAIALSEGSYAPHSILYEGPTESIPAELDEQLIRLALHNLIKNAAEADPESSSPIILRVQDNASTIIYEVEDHGPGIPEDIRASVFEAYVTTKHTGPTPGMGLGLAICQKIILEHNGKIDIESVPGRTIFRISIPRSRRGSLL